MSIDLRRARDHSLLDLIDAFERQPISQSVWRVVRENRDPLQGGRSPSRWCNGAFDVVYTSLERDGALSEVYELLATQPVWPSKIRTFVHQIAVHSLNTLCLPDLDALGGLGVDREKYRDRDYSRTQEIADAAYFLGFSGLLVPSARWQCHNLVVFTDRVPPADIKIEKSDIDPTDLRKWRAGAVESGDR